MEHSELEELLELGRGVSLDYDRTKTFVDLFTEQANLTPYNTAVVDKDSQLTYRELDEQSNSIAHWLIEEHDIKPDEFVAVMLPRRKEFVASVLGIMKAGAAYVPIDPEYPEERRRFMIDDCQTKVVIAEATLNVFRTMQNVTHAAINRADPDVLAYMIYTSGSTGTQKGVMVTHASLCAFAEFRQVLIEGKSGDAYDGEETKKEEYTFYDYALESTPKYEDETYFKELIGGTEATVYPRSRDADGTGRSRIVSIEMDKAAMEKERRREGVTASNHILHSLLQVLKSITREDRALIAAVSNGRSFNCMQKCQGFFVKTLPVLSEESAADL